MKSKLFLSGCLAGLLGASAGCGGPGGQESAQAAPPPEVDVIEVQLTSVDRSFEHVGRTEARDTVEVRARVEGFIEARRFKAGDDVSKGQLLYLLDRRTYQADLQEAKAAVADSEASLKYAREGVELLEAESQLVESEATLTQAQQDVERLRPLAEQEAVSQQNMDAAVASMRVAMAVVEARKAAVQQQRLTQQTDIERAQAALEQARAALKRAELNLDWTEIRAPVAGRIGESVAQVGALVSPSTPEPLTRLSPLDPISVSFQVSEQDYLSYMNRVRSGQHADVRQMDAPYELILTDGSVYPRRGSFRSIERELDQETATLEVTADFPNPDRLLLPGQFARVRVYVGQLSDVFLVPQRAVQQLQGTRSVLVADPDNTIAVKTISTSEQRDSNWVVTSGLRSGDRVVVAGLQRVRPGMKVRPRQVEESGSTGDSKQ